MRIPKSIILVNTNIAWKEEYKKYETIDLTTVVELYVYGKEISFRIVDDDSILIIKAYYSSNFSALLHSKIFLKKLNDLKVYMERKELFMYKNIAKQKIIETRSNTFIPMNFDDEEEEDEDD